MKVLFWGTPDFAIPSLRALLDEGHEVVGVVTRPDRPAGRGRVLTSSPVKEVALSEGVPVLTPERPRGDPFLAELRALDPEISVVVAYGHILRPEVLEFPPRGSVNVHASLLPKLRGAAPVNWAVARGDHQTGVTIMRMEEGLDSGPILLQRELPILPDDTAGGLYLRLAELGAEALMETLLLLELGKIEEVEQDHLHATYAPKVSREVARIDWSCPAWEVANHIRGMDMVPGAWSEWHGVPVKLFSPVPEDGLPDSLSSGAEPGIILSADPAEGLRVAAGSGSVLLREVQPPGKRRMPAGDWLRGSGPQVGDRFL